MYGPGPGASLVLLAWGIDGARDAEAGGARCSACHRSPYGLLESNLSILVDGHGSFLAARSVAQCVHSSSWNVALDFNLLVIQHLGFWSWTWNSIHGGISRKPAQVVVHVLLVLSCNVSLVCLVVYSHQLRNWITIKM